ncbi:MAG: hypothetical protein WAK60_03625 [Sedimentisphaerales bacterium]
MNGTYKTRNRRVDKIAFLGLFIAALLIARLVVVSRSAIVLSEPIELNFAGLSVSIPTGNGWQSEKQWRYQQNGFTLGSFFNSGSGSINAVVSCRYLLAATKAAPEVLFEEKASAVDGSEIVKTGRIEIGGPGSSFTKGSQNGGILTIDWAHIKRSKIPFDTFFGIAQLPNNRRFDIEVYQATGDIDLAEEVFKSVSGSLKFTDNQLLEAGSKIVAEIKGKGLDSFLASPKGEQGRENFFLIKDAGERTIGFLMEALGSRFAEKPPPPTVLGDGQKGDATVELAPEARLNILGGSFYYIRDRYNYRQATLFQSDNRFDEFVWKSQASGPAGRGGAEIVLGKDGIMAVKNFDPRVEERDYQISPAAIPDILGELTFSQMLDSDQKEILVDIIEADGKIIPVLVSRIEASRPPASQERSNGADVTGEEAAYVFKVELLNGTGFSEQVYLDDQRQILKKLSQQESTYTFERTSKENILKEFPEQGSYILQGKDKMLEQDQLQEDSE